MVTFYVMMMLMHGTQAQRTSLIELNAMCT